MERRLCKFLSFLVNAGVDLGGFLFLFLYAGSLQLRRTCDVVGLRRAIDGRGIGHLIRERIRRDFVGQAKEVRGCFCSEGGRLSRQQFAVVVAEFRGLCVVATPINC